MKIFVLSIYKNGREFNIECTESGFLFTGNMSPESAAIIVKESIGERTSMINDNFKKDKILIDIRE